MSSHRVLICILLCLAGFNTGCGRTAPSRFYGVAPLPGLSEAPSSSFTGIIGVGPITIPDYLDRPQILTRVSPHRLHLAESDKWAGALKQDIPRTVAQNLMTLLDSDQVLVFPWKSGIPVACQVTAEVFRFEAEPGVETILDVQWVLWTDDRRPARIRRSLIRVPFQETHYDAIVAAQSESLGILSREIAGEIQKL